MKIYGLTGNIGSGKSTVARMLRELGAFTVDADEVAREIVRPGEPALAEIVTCFGREVLHADGTLDRGALAKIVFASEGDREQLNRITHPRILERIKEKISGRSDERMVFVEASLIDREKGGLNDLIDGLVVVTCLGELRERRVVAPRLHGARGNPPSHGLTGARRGKGVSGRFSDKNSSDMRSLRAQVHILFESLCALES